MEYNLHHIIQFFCFANNCVNLFHEKGSLFRPQQNQGKSTRKNIYDFIQLHQKCLLNVISSVVGSPFCGTLPNLSTAFLHRRNRRRFGGFERGVPWLLANGCRSYFCCSKRLVMLKWSASSLSLGSLVFFI